ncbi:MAG: cation diffusion facilitator family transporter [Gammaproteobacteria bacterium]|nr:cation diffusion facilitator family transporter [Gammaproteobacteria bacterium]
MTDNHEKHNHTKGKACGHGHDAHDHSSHSHAGHSHAGHGHAGHSHAPANFNMAFALATGLNLLFTFIEAGYAIYAHSMSLLADAGHNLGDVIGLVFAWVASWLLTKAATERYSYGYKRTSILASIMNAFLLVAASAIIAYESVIKLFHPTIVDEKVVIIVAVIGIFINGGTALLFMRGQKDDLNIKGAYLHLAADALISIGVVIAGTIVMFTHLYWVDPLVGLAIVVTIVLGTWQLLRQSLNLLLDAVPHNVNYSGVNNYLSKLVGVSEVHDLHIWGLSTRESALTAHLVMPEATLSDEDYVKINHDLKTDFNINHVTIQVEKGSDEHQCKLQESC